MTTWIDYANFAIAISGLTIALLALLLTFGTQYMDKWTKHFFMLLFSVLILYVSCNLISQISLELLGPSFSWLSKLAIFFESFFSALLMPFLTMYILHKSGERYSCFLMYLVMIMIFAYTAILLITQFTEEFYYITPSNVYRRGPLYFALLIPPVIIMLSNIIALLGRKDKISSRDRTILCMYHLFPLLAMILQIFFYGLFLIVLGTSISALIMFIHFVNVDADKHLEQKVKIAEQDFLARALQMRPHFIYNTLSNIYYLCELDPLKAQKVIDDFSTYLKKNFSAVAKQGLITFEEELEHTKAYVAVVQARYEDMLYVDFDTPLTNFKLPPLTLEPLVENAVKHALDPDADPLYIMVRTRRENSYNLIIVENTGENFPIDENDNFLSSTMNDEPHIGLANVKSRLAASCGGSLKLSPRPDGGTIATIRIPADQTVFSENKNRHYRSLNIN